MKPLPPAADILQRFDMTIADVTALLDCSPRSVTNYRTVQTPRTVALACHHLNTILHSSTSRAHRLRHRLSNPKASQADRPALFR
jgi:hypothetical protein